MVDIYVFYGGVKKASEGLIQDLGAQGMDLSGSSESQNYFGLRIYRLTQIVFDNLFVYMYTDVFVTYQLMYKKRYLSVFKHYVFVA